MAKNPSGHNIYSGSKSKMIFQSPDDNLDKFDYINKVKEEENGSGSGSDSDSDSNSDSKSSPYSNISKVGTQLCVQIMNKIAKFIKKMFAPNSGKGQNQGQDQNQDSDF